MLEAAKLKGGISRCQSLAWIAYKRVRALRVSAILLSVWTWRHGNAAAGVKDCDKHGRTSGRAVDQAYRAILIELMALLEEGDCRI